MADGEVVSDSFAAGELVDKVDIVGKELCIADDGPCFLEDIPERARNALIRNLRFDELKILRRVSKKLKNVVDSSAYFAQSGCFKVPLDFRQLLAQMFPDVPSENQALEWFSDFIGSPPAPFQEWDTVRVAGDAFSSSHRAIFKQGNVGPRIKNLQIFNCLLSWVDLLKAFGAFGESMDSLSVFFNAKVFADPWAWCLFFEQLGRKYAFQYDVEGKENQKINVMDMELESITDPVLRILLEDPVKFNSMSKVSINVHYVEWTNVLLRLLRFKCLENAISDLHIVVNIGHDPSARPPHVLNDHKLLEIQPLLTMNLKSLKILKLRLASDTIWHTPLDSTEEIPCLQVQLTICQVLQAISMDTLEVFDLEVPRMDLCFISPKVIPMGKLLTQFVDCTPNLKVLKLLVVSVSMDSFPFLKKLVTRVKQREIECDMRGYEYWHPGLPKMSYARLKPYMTAIRLQVGNNSDPESVQNATISQRFKYHEVMHDFITVHVTGECPNLISWDIDILQTTFPNLKCLFLDDTGFNDLMQDYPKNCIAAAYRKLSLNDSDMAIIFSSFQSLMRLELCTNMIQVTDFGMTGLKPEVIKMIEMGGPYCPTKDDFQGPSIVDMKNLHVLTVVGIGQRVTDATAFLIGRSAHLLPHLGDITLFQPKVSLYGWKGLMSGFPDRSQFKNVVELLDSFDIDTLE